MFHLCPYCGRIMLKSTMQVDHIHAVNRAKKHRLSRIWIPDGDVNSLHNLTSACPACNKKKADHGGTWVLRARIGKVLFPVIWVLLVLATLLFAVGVVSGWLPRGFLLPYLSRALSGVRGQVSNSIINFFP